jgi:hypothetical protein
VYDGHGIVGEGDLAAKKAKSYLPIRLGEVRVVRYLFYTIIVLIYICEF